MVEKRGLEHMAAIGRRGYAATLRNHGEAVPRERREHGTSDLLGTSI